MKKFYLFVSVLFLSAGVCAQQQGNFGGQCSGGGWTSICANNPNYNDVAVSPTAPLQDMAEEEQLDSNVKAAQFFVPGFISGFRVWIGEPTSTGEVILSVLVPVDPKNVISWWNENVKNAETQKEVSGPSTHSGFGMVK